MQIHIVDLPFSWRNLELSTAILVYPGVATNSIVCRENQVAAVSGNALQAKVAMALVGWFHPREQVVPLCCNIWYVWYIAPNLPRVKLFAKPKLEPVRLY